MCVQCSFNIAFRVISLGVWVIEYFARKYVLFLLGVNSYGLPYKRSDLKPLGKPSSILSWIFALYAAGYKIIRPMYNHFRVIAQGIHAMSDACSSNVSLMQT